MNEQAVLVAATLHQAGFSVDIANNSILCWLNRPMNKQEIEIVLEDYEVDIRMSPGGNLAKIICS